MSKDDLLKYIGDKKQPIIDLDSKTGGDNELLMAVQESKVNNSTIIRADFSQDINSNKPK